MKVVLPTLIVGAGLVMLGVVAPQAARQPDRQVGFPPAPPWPPARNNPGRPQAAERRLPIRPAQAEVSSAPVELREVPSPEESVVINEVQYHPEGGDRRDEWVEILNRSRREVDIGGWTLAGGVQFTFPAGATLAPGAYLVVCADRERVRGTFGIENLAGNWTGELPDGGGTIRLASAAGKLVESFAYDDNGPFPVLPDGLGRSLERRDPHGRADFPGNWGASSESQGGSGWMRLQGTGWVPTKKFYLYLLGAGVAYVDDLVLRPVGGDADAGGGGEIRLGFEEEEEGRVNFRFNGNHSSSTIDGEEARSGKRCLKIVARGSGNSSQSSVTVDVPGIILGAQYQLECWALVDPQAPLQVRFSKGRSSRTTVVFDPDGRQVREVVVGGGAGGPLLSVQSSAGGATVGSSPGRTNTIYSTKVPPYIFPVGHAPSRPGPADAIVVTAKVAPGEEIAEVILQVDESGIGRRVLPLRDSGLSEDGDARAGDGIHSARLGPYPKNTLVLYSVLAKDRSGRRGVYPFEGNPTRTMGVFVEDTEVKAKVPVYHLFVDESQLANLDQDPYSDTYRPGTFVHDGIVYCDVGVRYRGQTSRFIPKRHWKVKFQRDRRFATPTGQKARSINLNSFFGDSTYLREALSYSLWRDLGEPYHECWHVRMYLNGSYQGLYLNLEVPNEDFMARNGIDGGWLWKSYSDGHDGLNYEIEAGDDKAGQPLLMDFFRNLGSLSGKRLEDYLREHVDVDSFLTFLAASQAIHSADHVQKNYLVYLDTDHKFTYLPWDMDLTHGRNYECQAGGIWNALIRHDHWDEQYRDDKLLFATRAHPKCDGFWNLLIDAFLSRTRTFQPAYYKRTAELLAHHYHPDILIPRIRRLADGIREEARLDRAKWPASRGDGDFDRSLARLERWANDRYRHLSAKLEGLGVAVGKPLNACFEAEGSRGPAPLTVQFKNLSVGEIAGYRWEFGDGETSTEREPRHAYSKPGRYEVKLTVTGPAGTHALARRAMVAALAR